MEPQVRDRTRGVITLTCAIVIGAAPLVALALGIARPGLAVTTVALCVFLALGASGARALTYRVDRTGAPEPEDAAEVIAPLVPRTR